MVEDRMSFILLVSLAFLQSYLKEKYFSQLIYMFLNHSLFLHLHGQKNPFAWSIESIYVFFLNRSKTLRSGCMLFMILYNRLFSYRSLYPRTPLSTFVLFCFVLFPLYRGQFFFRGAQSLHKRFLPQYAYKPNYTFHKSSL